MKLKNYWKRFWTLDRHHAEGFTLVELIVVIAILAILAGVGIPVYSGYITKANKQADMTLISEIEHALTLAYYNGTFEEGESGYIVLSANEAYYSENTGDNIALDQALKATFGDNYSLQLKYDGWEVDSAILNAATHDYADAIANSSYIANVGTDKLLNDVQNCSTKLAELLVRLGGDWAGDAGAESLNALVGNDTIKNLLAAGQYSGDKITADVLANATVFGVAGSIDDTERENISNNFNGGYYLLRNNSSIAGTYGYEPISTDNIVDVAHTYAALEALVGYVDDPEISGYFSGINMNGSASQIVTNIQSAGDNIVKYAMANPNSATTKKICEYYGVDYIGDVANNTATSSPAIQDGQAYTAIMQTVSDLQGDYLGELGTANLFTTGGINNRVNDLVTAVSLNSYLTGVDGDGHEALRALMAGTDESTIIITYTNKGGSLNCGVIPIAADSSNAN